MAPAICSSLTASTSASFVDLLAPGDVHQHGMGRHRGEHRAVDHPPGLVGQLGAHDEEVALGGHLEQPVGRQDDVGTVDVVPGAVDRPAGRDHPHAECLRHAADLAPDPAEPDHAHRRTGDRAHLVAAAGEPPVALLAGCLVEPAGHEHRRRHGVLRDRTCRDRAPARRERHVRGPQIAAVQVRDARLGVVRPPQAGCAAGDRTRYRIPDENDVGLAEQSVALVHAEPRRPVPARPGSSSWSSLAKAALPSTTTTLGSIATYERSAPSHGAITSTVTESDSRSLTSPFNCSPATTPTSGDRMAHDRDPDQCLAVALTRRCERHPGTVPADRRRPDAA